ncbi:glycosyltransferase, partial [Actinotalea sp. K2]|nr:glycosyltransferase [Actinotalea sp. K2]
MSVVLVNYRGAEDTITCLRSFADLDWPRERLEVIVVDNDSGDGSAERIRAEVPETIIVESGANTGFAGGCNLGVAHATGEVIGFINNDARPGPGWVRAGGGGPGGGRTLAPVAGKGLGWGGELGDYGDGARAWVVLGVK